MNIWRESEDEKNEMAYNTDGLIIHPVEFPLSSDSMGPASSNPSGSAISYFPTELPHSSTACSGK